MPDISHCEYHRIRTPTTRLVFTLARDGLAPDMGHARFRFNSTFPAFYFIARDASNTALPACQQLFSYHIIRTLLPQLVLGPAHKATYEISIHFVVPLRCRSIAVSNGDAMSL